MKIATQFTEIKTADGLCESFVAYPENTNNLPVVLFYMDAIGLRPQIYEMVEKIAREGYFVFAPNFFYRISKIPIIDYDIFFKKETQADAFKEIRAMIGQYTAEMGKTDGMAFLNFAKSFPMVDAKKIGAVGYCMGGAQAIRAAGNFPDDFRAIASFHAGNLATDSESSPHLYLKKMKAELYIGHADKDPSMPKEMMTKLEHELQQTNLKYKTELYPDCLHGWTMSDLAIYNKEGEEKHWNELFKLLRNL
jgi:carboxymethylenebutenolidase